MAMRLPTRCLEPLWKATYVDSVQITMAEDIGIGTRAGYYDGIGAARDISRITSCSSWRSQRWRSPLYFHPRDPRGEGESPIAVRLPEDLGSATARGQYAGGWQGGDRVRVTLKKTVFLPIRRRTRSRPVKPWR